MRLRASISGAWVTGIFFVCSAFVSSLAQETPREFLPEIDVHLKLNSQAQVYVQAKDDRDGGDPVQASIGPSFQLYRKPLLNLKRLIVFDLDPTQSRLLVLEAGYRVITAPNTAIKNRAISAVTFSFPLLHEVAVSNRDRVDLDWKSGEFSWRFRNKLLLTREFTIRSFRFAPYAAWEPFYLSQYGKFATTDLYAGSTFALHERVMLDAYYQHENDTGQSPNSQKNYIGLILRLFFSRPEKRNARATP
jgi:hypothetical protein